MPKNLTVALAAEMQKSENKPVELYQLYLDEQTVYFANFPVDIHFYDALGSEQVYTALGLRRSPVKMNITTRTNEVTVSLDNIDLSIAAIIANTKLTGRRMVIWKVLRMAPDVIEEDLAEGDITGGVRTSLEYDLTELGTCEDSKISYILNTGQIATVETRISIDDGVTWGDWVVVVSGQTIPGLYFGQDLTDVLLRIRQTPVAAVASCNFAIGILGETFSDAADYDIIFDGTMDEPTVGEYAAEVTVLSSLDYLGRQLPGRVYSKSCGVKFGGTSCGASLVEVSGIVLTISPNGKTLTLSGRAEAAGYYSDGVIVIGNDYRRVVSSSGATYVLDYAFIGIAVTDAYTLHRQCDKRFVTCRDKFANQANFRGFRAVPNEIRIFKQG